MVPALPAVPPSKNCASLASVGGPVGVQFPPVGPLVFAPAGVHTIAGLNGPVGDMVMVKVFVTGVILTFGAGFVSAITLITYVFDGVSAVVVTLRVKL